MIQIKIKYWLLGILILMSLSISILLFGCVIRPVIVSPTVSPTPTKTSTSTPTPTQTPAQTPTPMIYYVAKSGSDSNTGTQSSPWLTIQKAANTMQAGDTVLVRAGTYYGGVRPANSGSSGAYITYKAYPGETVVIDGSSGSYDSWGLFGISQKQYIVVDGFEIRNTGSSSRVYPGVQVGGSSTAYITLKNLTIHNCANSGILAFGTGTFPAAAFIKNLTIDNCVLYHNNVYWGQESLSLIAVDGFEVKNCKVYDAQGTLGGRGEVVEGIDCKEGTKNGSIHDCEVYETLIGIYIDCGKTPEGNIAVYNNKLHDNYYEGIVLAAEDGAELSDVRIYNNLIYYNRDRGFIIENYNFNVSFSFINNTLYHNTNAEIAVYNPDALTKGVIRNNIICADSKYSFLLAYSDQDIKNTVIDHNLFYNSSLYDGQKNALGIKYLVVDPLFVNAAGLDFHLQNSSPAINAGSSESAPEKDYDGINRPQGKGYDLGAFEYPVPAPTATPSPTPTPGK